MDKSFWLNCWRSRNIGFHESQTNALLMQYWSELDIAPPATVFLPLCGKTRDIHWFLQQGYRVVGVEFSETAVLELFTELGVEPVTTLMGSLKRLSAPQVDIYLGDIFALDAKTLGQIDASYDRAALVALPLEMRRRYTQHLITLTQVAPQLLITFAYNQSQMAGPPFSVSSAEVQSHYANSYTPRLAGGRPVQGGLKGQCPAQEQAWTLLPR